jgi:DNA-binding Xre family transcriptional regulator
MKSNKHSPLGGDFDDFLHQEKIHDEVLAAALKRTVAIELARRMAAKRISVAALARRLNTSRAVVQRVLDEGNTSLTLHTLARTAAALGCKVTLNISAA